jgi:hypothetical protein
MRPTTALPLVAAAVLVLAVGQFACSGNSSNSGFGDDGGTSSGSGGGSGGSGGGSGSSGGGSGSSGGGFDQDGGFVTGDGSTPPPQEGSVTVMTTVYAHTDDTLYQVDPVHQTVTMIGPMVGTSDSSTDSTITDLAVDGNGGVWVNSESVVYKANLPSSGTGTVLLTKVTTIGSSAKFYALAFAPAGALDPNNETLVGGDSDGNLWSINTMTGASTNLGNFGNDPTTTGNVFELSGDLVFYLDSMNNPTGLATIRSCKSGGSSTTCGSDYLAGVNMANLKTAYTSGTAAATLLGGIYGSTGSGSSFALGSGTTFHDVFGLGAWNSTIFGFTRHTTTQTNPELITIDTTSGAGTVVPGLNFTFTNGWSGAGVTTKVTITAPPPPPPPSRRSSSAPTPPPWATVCCHRRVATRQRAAASWGP